MGNRQDFRDVGRMIWDGKLDPQVDRVFELDEIAEAHRVIEDRGVFGKVVVKP